MSHAMSHAIRQCHAVIAAALMLLPAAPSVGDDVIPRGQTQPPGPPLSPQQALAKMRVPPGFRVELVAAEPQIVNPVAMAFDDQGRIWVTESFEYPRSSAGPGRDRIKVLEDTDGDGVVDKTTVFAEGLNIPSGIAVGHGGVWVANAPDLLLLQDTDGDLKADRREVVVTGFGRTDTHELPNSLTWGPDGYLYGLNGVFNYSHVKHQGREHQFTCALFRVHPRRRTFELFAEGTSNPWGIAWDHEGSAFVSACVIDHLWHLVESGYYHRQGGPYPPHTWKIESIVKHKHQKAAYCGIHFFDSDAYPAEYRERLYMGNIHAGCINADILERRGATYFARPAPDFLTANDVWFMPVAQKTGPDGCLYVLDWYDRYHCYQDARRDPEGLDRLKGRLYRIRYGDAPRANVKLGAESDAELIARLASGNGFEREIALRLLQERLAAGACSEAVVAELQRQSLDPDLATRWRLAALWALAGGDTVATPYLLQLLESDNASLRAWAVRVAGNQPQAAAAVRKRIVELAGDSSPDVLLQVAIAAGKITELPALKMLLDVAVAAGDDPLLPHVVWQNLHPRLDTSERFVAALSRHRLADAPGLRPLLARAARRLPPDGAAELAAQLLKTDPDAAAESLQTLSDRVVEGGASAAAVAAIRSRLGKQLAPAWSDPANSLHLPAALLGAAWGEPAALAAAERVLADDPVESRRLTALRALVAAQAPAVLKRTPELLANPKLSGGFRGELISSLGRLNSAAVAPLLLKAYSQLDADLQPRAVALLIQRPEWARALLAAIGARQIPASVLSNSQVLELQSSENAELSQLVREKWGVVRAERSPERERVIGQIKQLLAGGEGDPQKGLAVYAKLCGQCHQLYGQGQAVGPDLTANGRATYDQLLSNVFDPNLVIGAAYQARSIRTVDGRTLTGLLVEDNPQRVVLKLQGAKEEAVPREQIEAFRVSPISMMPEGVEKQLKEDELRDLFALLMLDRPPSDPQAQKIRGAPGN